MLKPLNPVRILTALPKVVANSQAMIGDPKSAEEIYSSKSKMYEGSSSKNISNNNNFASLKLKAPSKNGPQMEKLRNEQKEDRMSKENVEAKKKAVIYEDKPEETTPITKRINVSRKKVNTIFDNSGVLLIGSHKIIKKKPAENLNFGKKISLPNNIESSVPITKRIHSQPKKD